MDAVTIQAIHNDNKSFTVPRQPGISLLQLVNARCDDPKREGIPYICSKGVCRSCTVKVTARPELLAAPSMAERRALDVGRTTIALGYRLACLCCFASENSDSAAP